MCLRFVLDSAESPFSGLVRGTCETSRGIPKDAFNGQFPPHFVIVGTMGTASAALANFSAEFVAIFHDAYLYTVENSSYLILCRA
jgi:hypothetical protein